MWRKRKASNDQYLNVHAVPSLFPFASSNSSEELLEPYNNSVKKIEPFSKKWKIKDTNDYRKKVHQKIEPFAKKWKIKDTNDYSNKILQSYVSKNDSEVIDNSYTLETEDIFGKGYLTSTSHANPASDNEIETDTVMEIIYIPEKNNVEMATFTEEITETSIVDELLNTTNAIEKDKCVSDTLPHIVFEAAVTTDVEPSTSPEPRIEINSPLFKKVVKKTKQIETKLGNRYPPSVSHSVTITSKKSSTLPKSTLKLNSVFEKNRNRNKQLPAKVNGIFTSSVYPSNTLITEKPLPVRKPRIKINSTLFEKKTVNKNKQWKTKISDMYYSSNITQPVVNKLLTVSKPRIKMNSTSLEKTLNRINHSQTAVHDMSLHTICESINSTNSRPLPKSIKKIHFSSSLKVDNQTKQLQPKIKDTILHSDSRPVNITSNKQLAAHKTSVRTNSKKSTKTIGQTVQFKTDFGDISSHALYQLINGTDDKFLPADKTSENNNFALLTNSIDKDEQPITFDNITSCVVPDKNYTNKSSTTSKTSKAKSLLSKMVASHKNPLPFEKDDISSRTASSNTNNKLALFPKINKKNNSTFENVVCENKQLKAEIKLMVKTIKKLENRVHQLRTKRNGKAEITEEKSNYLLHTIFNKDQVQYLVFSRKFVSWSDDTVKKALRLKHYCGSGGYKELLRQKLPLPTLQTLQKRERLLKNNLQPDLHQNA